MTDHQKWILFKTVINNRYIPVRPTAKQLLALCNDSRELFYGGAAGGGKSVFLLMNALQYVESGDYSALILRKTFSDLSKPGALIPMSHDWLSGTDAEWSGSDKKWTFPSGAVLQFGHMEHENAKYNYQGGAYHFIGFDELPHFSESQYRYLFSRLRKKVDSSVPSKIRSTGNPDGPGFEWVKHRFVDPGSPDRPFIPSKLSDNPHLDSDDYIQSLQLLDPITKAKLLHGDWNSKLTGNFFDLSKIEFVSEWEVPKDIRCVRAWDLAATPEPPAGSSADPDYTVGAKLGISDGVVYILDIVRGRWGYDQTNAKMLETAKKDTIETLIYCEEEPGSSGKRNIHHLMTRTLAGFPFAGSRVTGQKDVRARPFAGWVSAGLCKMIRADWNNKLLDEMALFPFVDHDDQVDALTLAFEKCTQMQEEPEPQTFGKSILAEYQTEIF